ncbi:SANT/Myb-like DNA-binding domain-containing protein [Bradyrhizobium sp. NAS96.2]|uniref:SANT/Myb-like DNA-binding domain-containing protein n=1 Tax=Bradyrhizobium sp. NAS96.2 TaxID=1680160 RepID=UPI00093F5139|nr:SANT/Myb-like DNA-binding domain-containing protein [Bradyrhizobium sp. NAS96.2]OKO67472.1 hypothetical protein AC628_38990 [Bradyrhizobium sp. NAS96.2]
MSRGPAWTAEEHAELIRLRSGDGVTMRPWATIALPGRTSKACENEFYKARLAQRTISAFQKKRRGRPPGPAVKPALVDEVAIAAPKARCERRQQDLDVLRDWAELRDRIAVCGLTGGVLGDPRPGRSALDQRRAASRDGNGAG